MTQKKWFLAVASIAGLLVAVWTTQSGFADEENKEEKKEEAKADGKKYIGVGQCKTCHAEEAKGDQFGHWTKSRHAKAFETLATDKAKEVATKLGIDDPQKSEKCLKCHTTEASVPAALLADTFEKAKGVGCESCHGPGDEYSDVGAMKDRKKAVEAGLVIPSEKVCVSCHNKESPSYKPFDFAEAVKKIAHPKPKKD